MSVIYLLIVISIVLALIFLGAFFWAVKSGQYEDDYSPSVRILMDDADFNQSGDEKPTIKTNKTA